MDKDHNGDVLKGRGASVEVPEIRHGSATIPKQSSHTLSIDLCTMHVQTVRSILRWPKLQGFN